MVSSSKEKLRTERLSELSEFYNNGVSFSLFSREVGLYWSGLYGMIPIELLKLNYLKSVRFCRLFLPKVGVFTIFVSGRLSKPSDSSSCFFGISIDSSLKFWNLLLPNKSYKACIVLSYVGFKSIVENEVGPTI